MLGHDTKINAVKVSADGEQVAVASDGARVALYGVDDGKQVQAWSHHGACVNAFAYSGDGTYSVSGSSDGTVCLYKKIMQKKMRK